MAAPNANWEVRNSVKQLEKKLTQRIEELEKFKEDMMSWASIMAFYKGSDRRDVPCLITGAFARAGTVDVIVFDNMDSGGGREVSGTTLGTGLNQVRPILRAPAVEEVENETVSEDLADEFVAAKR